MRGEGRKAEKKEEGRKQGKKKGREGRRKKGKIKREKKKENCQGEKALTIELEGFVCLWQENLGVNGEDFFTGGKLLVDSEKLHSTYKTLNISLVTST